MTAKELQRIGRRLFGNDWQSPLGRKLGKHRITVWRWGTGRTPIPDADAMTIKIMDEAKKAKKS